MDAFNLTQHPWNNVVRMTAPSPVLNEFGAGKGEGVALPQEHIVLYTIADMGGKWRR